MGSRSIQEATGMTAPHPSQLLDETVHQRSRLGILAVLAEADQVDFGFLKDTLELSDGNLSRHLRVLEEAGYVAIEKGYQDRRPRTWVRATKQGRRALREHLSALQRIIDQVREE
jgi:DNA-binding MarR family transcriptional regulator